MNADSWSNEERYIIACLSAELTGGKAPAPDANTLDWDKLAERLEAHRLAPYFYTLAHKHALSLPEPLRLRLKQKRYALLLYGDTCRKQIAHLLEAMNQRQIASIVMKGWALISTLYEGDHGRRYYEDIDILIQPQDTDRVEQLLDELRYVGMDEVTPGYTRRLYNARAYKYTRSQPAGADRFSVGLHWGLTHYPYYDRGRISIPELFHRAHPLQIAGISTLEMAVGDQIIYTCAHLALHHRNRENLLNYYEIAWMIRQAQPGPDWEEIFRRARAWGYLVQLQTTLAAVERLWPGTIPCAALSAITGERTSWQDRWIDRLVSLTMGNAFLSGTIEFLAIPGLFNKIYAAYFQIFPNPAYMRARYASSQQESMLSLYWKRGQGVIRAMRPLRSLSSQSNEKSDKINGN